MMPSRYADRGVVGEEWSLGRPQFNFEASGVCRQVAGNQRIRWEGQSRIGIGRMLPEALVAGV